MGLLERIRGMSPQARPRADRKSFVQPPFWSYEQMRSPLLSSTSLTGGTETLPIDYEAYALGGFKETGPVASCVVARQMVFSEARFQFQQLRGGRPGDLFGSPELELLEDPWPGGTTGELLARMELDASLAGNFYAVVADDQGRLGRRAQGSRRRIARLRPDWVTILIGSTTDDPYAADATVVGYLYEPRPSGTRDAVAGPVTFLPSEVCHYSPLPDPIARFRGMSWLTPVLRDIGADKSATLHKSRFFDNGATPNMVIKYDKDMAEDSFTEFVEEFKATHQGAWNAYKTLHLAGGADVEVVGSDFRQLDFSSTQGKGEARIASAAGVPPSWVGFSEGLQGSSLNSGNFAAARRRFADGTIRPLWRMAAASLQVLVPPPAGARLWVDTRDIAFLREDRIDAAAIQNQEANTMRQMIESGWEPDSVKDAVVAEDWKRLSHTGVFSVQLQPPTTADGPSEAELSKDVADVQALQAQTMQTLINAGWEEESVREAVLTGDLSRLQLTEPEPEPSQDPPDEPADPQEGQ